MALVILKEPPERPLMITGCSWLASVKPSQFISKGTFDKMIGGRSIVWADAGSPKTIKIETRLRISLPGFKRVILAPYLSRI